jgi:hypothetical protein
MYNIVMVEFAIAHVFILTCRNYNDAVLLDTEELLSTCISLVYLLTKKIKNVFSFLFLHRSRTFNLWIIWLVDQRHWIGLVNIDYQIYVFLEVNSYVDWLVSCNYEVSSNNSSSLQWEYKKRSLGISICKPML